VKKLELFAAALLILGSGCGDKPPTGTEAGVNLRIEAMYVVQSVQRREGTVPLVTGKDGLLRVFVLANAANSLTPTVRVQLLKNGVVQQVINIPAPAASVPTSVDQSSLAKSWNVPIPAASIEPGLQIIAEVDPTDAIEEANEDDNAFPVSGAPASLQVAALQPFKIRFVSIIQAENGRIGNVNASNIESYLTFTRKIHPVSVIDADLRAPYTVNGLGFDPQGNTWQAAVAELDAVRAAEGSDRFYYGVVNTEYEGGGVVGIAAGIPANTALGWDRFPDAPITVAHEIGHDWGRRHAPCGGAGGPDPNYPYSVGLIGVYGFDAETNEVKVPSANTDIMGYCNARFWISDYNFEAIVNYRLANPASAPPVAVPSLVVWGHIENGVPRLEPAFQAITRPSPPTAPGPYHIEALDAAGRQVFAYNFSASAAPDAPGDIRHFAFAIPLSDESTGRIDALRLVARGRESRIEAGRSTSTVPAGRPGVQLRQAADRVTMSWDASAYPLVIVRDAATGEILSLARGGTANVVARGGVRLEYSNGIRTVTGPTGR
jgi:hypothetical protein